MHKNKKKNHKKKVSYNAPQRPLYLAPPHFTLQENRSWTIRFTNGATATVGSTINLGQFAAALGVICVTAITCRFICDQFRIRRICLWSPVATAGVPVTNELKWIDDPAATVTSGAPRTQSDTSISFDRPAYVCLTPPKDNSSVFSQWLDSSLTTPWVQLAAPAGSVMDIHFNFIIDDIGDTTAGPAIVGGTPGDIYHKGFVTGAATWAVANLQQNPI